MRNTFLVLFVLTAAVLPVSADDSATVRAELTEVVAKPLEKTTVIPGELAPYRQVDIHAKVTAFVEAIHVDRGSYVNKGQALAELSAPELLAQRAEAQAKIPAVAAQRIEAEAKLAAAESTYQRLAEAAKTPGVVAGNDVILAEKAVEAERARIDSLDKTIAAYEASVKAIEEIEKYLNVTAPFAGVITERFAHEGALVGPQGEAGMALFTLEQIGRLRLVAAVPEAYKQSISRGARVQFTVPAFPSETFTGVVARPAYAVDSKTRTMPVELDVTNSGNKLTPGMYAEVRWPISRSGESLFVPRTAMKSTTERIFVIRVRNGTAEWVDVRRGMSEGNQVEVFGDLQAGDRIVLRATDEIRPGTRVQPAS
ncbi:MAG: efflux RND transporter periplasmic adaptor subunit [Acidobacteria bacterium]|nr:efflux RND transporter periplasmic adaptor subunit [Acidobacteriota bacterium]